MSETSAELKASWQSPSNIALVKYWGKKGDQLPANPSISFTLDEAVTRTSVKLGAAKSNKGISLDFRFEGQRQEDFGKKLEIYLEKAATNFPWLHEYHLEIESSNTFPHSSGIASSASAYSALALCLCDLHEAITGRPLEDFYQHASYWARIGSGSACRSVYGGYNLWGKTADWSKSSDEFAVRIPDSEIHSVFQDFSDTILIIEQGKKAVSSSQGHGLLKSHPFAEGRYRLGFEHTGRLLQVLKQGEMADFIQIVEAEALMLHALMMTSPTPFILMKPNTLKVLQKIWDYRIQTGHNVMFTLDAGANVHLLSPASESIQTLAFVQNELVGYCENGQYFCNQIGAGPIKTQTLA